MRRIASHHRDLQHCSALAWFGICADRDRFRLRSHETTGAPAPRTRYPQLPAKNVPDYLKNSIFERVYVADTNPMPVSGYALIANLPGTGDTRVANPVREWMIKEMEKRGFGSRQLGYGDMTPESILNDPGHRFAIARVDGFVPAGGARGTASTFRSPACRRITRAALQAATSTAPS